MTNNPFAALDKVKATLNLNEAYDKEIRAIQNRRVMVQNWKNEFNKQQREKAKKKFRGYE